MKALVTGATGIVGANLVRLLLERGHEVRALIRATSDDAAIRRLPVERWTGDVLDVQSLRGVAHGCSVVFHAAAVFAYWGHSRDELEATAVTGTRNLLEAARDARVERVILTSSSVTLGSSAIPEVRDERSRFDEPRPSAYTRSKVRQEHVALESAAELGLDMTVVCPALVVGRYDYRLSPSSAAVVNYLNDPFRSTFLGGCNFVSARDVAAGHLIAAERGDSMARYALSSENLRWRDAHALISRLSGTFGPSLTLNDTAAYLAAVVAETSARLAGSRPLATRDEAVMAGRFYWYDSGAIKALGYAPAPSDEALAEAIAWCIQRAFLNESVIDSMMPESRVVEHFEAMAKGAA